MSAEPPDVPLGLSTPCGLGSRKLVALEVWRDAAVVTERLGGGVRLGEAELKSSRQGPSHRVDETAASSYPQRREQIRCLELE